MGRTEAIKEHIARVSKTIDSCEQTPGLRTWSRNLKGAFTARWSDHPNDAKERAALELLQQRSSPDFWVACMSSFSKTFITDHLKTVIHDIVKHDEKSKIAWDCDFKAEVMSQDIQADGYRKWVTEFHDHCIVGQTTIDSTSSRDTDFQNRCGAEKTTVDSTSSGADIRAELHKHGIKAETIPFLKDADENLWRPYSTLPQLLDHTKCWTTVEHQS